jgi:acetyltransferase-like isoleucine patch superfamily enzyme
MILKKIQTSLSIFQILLTSGLENLTRKLLSLYRLFRLSFDGSPRRIFPIAIEGRGVVKFGKSADLGRKIVLGCARNAFLNFGNNTQIRDFVEIRITEGQKGNFGHDFSVGTHSRFYIHSNWEIGENVKIATYCSIFAREPLQNGRLIIHGNCNIGDYGIFDLSDDIEIEENVAIGPNCIIYTHDHEYHDFSKATWKGGIVKGNIKIKEGAWVGAGTIILPGVTIGKRTVVAAGSVVTRSLAPNGVYAGVPAKKIKDIMPE